MGSQKNKTSPFHALPPYGVDSSKWIEGAQHNFVKDRGQILISEPASKNKHLMKFLPIPVASRISVRHPCLFRPVVQFFHTLSNISNISDKGYK